MIQKRLLMLIAIGVRIDIGGADSRLGCLHLPDHSKANETRAVWQKSAA
jgi:hypothetical protein